MRRTAMVAAMLSCVGMVAACGDEETADTAPSTTVVATDTTSMTVTVAETTSTTGPAATTASTTVEAADTTAATTDAADTTADEGTVTFESKHYPFALRLPEGVEDGSWVDARRAWDGAQGIDMAGPYPDVVFLPERSLFLFGAATPVDLETFVADFAAMAIQRHLCSEPQNRREVTIGGDPAVGFTQSCEESTIQARVALIHDGFGFIAFSTTVAGEENTALDEVIAALAGLEWRTE